jgi:anaerobic selenocysteine-containing dehydrogenase
LLVPGHQEIAFEDGLFETPSGKIELESAEAVQRWQVDRLPAWSVPRESALHGESGGLFLQLLTPNTKNRIHSQFRGLAMIDANDPGPRVSMSPVDAAPRGIRDGDRVRIFNDRGEIEIVASLDFSLRAGCVCVTNGWWASDGAAVNLLSRGRETDMGHGAAFHDNLVRVEPVKRTAP